MSNSENVTLYGYRLVVNNGIAHMVKVVLSALYRNDMYRIDRKEGFSTLLLRLSKDDLGEVFRHIPNNHTLLVLDKEQDTKAKKLFLEYLGKELEIQREAYNRACSVYYSFEISPIES